MMISRELEATLSLAVREAARRKHEFLTLEHVLFALLHDDEVEEVVRECGGDVDLLKREIELFLSEKSEDPEDGDGRGGTLVDVKIRPRRARDRRTMAIPQAEQILASIRSYLIAQVL